MGRDRTTLDRLPMRAVVLKDRKMWGALLGRALRWHLRYLWTKAPSPLSCSLYITSRCNLKCRFCNIHRKPVPQTLPLSTAVRLIDDLSDLGCFYLSLSGGEPLLVEHLFAVLAHARKKIPYLHLVTNGFLLDVPASLRLKEAGVREVSISIDGKEDAHDSARGVPGSYAHAVRAVENLRQYAPAITVVLNAILDPEKPEACLPVLDLARKLGVYLKVQPLNQHPDFYSRDPARVWRGDIPCARLQETIAKLRSDDLVVNSALFLDNIYHFFCRKERLIFSRSACLLGYHHVEVLEDGRIFPCLEGLDWERGLDAGCGLKGLLRSERYRRIVEQLKSCQGCRRSYYICYYEPRISFPVGHFLRSSFSR